MGNPNEQPDGAAPDRPWPPFDPSRGSTEPLPGRCGARIRRSAENGYERYCKNRPVPDGNGRCRFHGGLTPTGIARPNHNPRTYRGADLPEKLAARFMAGIDDPELLSLRNEMALVDARTVQLVEKLPTEESAAAWAAIASAIIDGTTALERLTTTNDDDDRAREAAMIRSAFDRLARAQTLAASERSIWGEIVAHIEVRRRLADTDRRREEALGVTLTLRQGMTLIGALLTTISEEIADPAVKYRVAQRLGTLLAIAAPGIAPEPVEIGVEASPTPADE